MNKLRVTPVLPVQRLSQHFFPDVDPHCLPEGGTEVWGERCCGLACIRMLLRYYKLPVPEQAAMLQRGLQIGAFSEQGWIHSGLVRLAETWGLTGVTRRVDEMAELGDLTAAGLAPIVSSTFRFPQDGRREGHLVVFRGISMADGQPVANFADPSRWGASNDAVASQRFWASCTGNIIVLWPNGANPLARGNSVEKGAAGEG